MVMVYQPLGDFWSKVNIGKPHECWEIRKELTNVDERGRTRVSIWDGSKRRSQLGHRVAYTLDRGEEPEKGKKVCHSCDNPPCCNPAHLWVGTQADNLNDMKKKKRGSNRNRVITNDEKQQIVELRRQGASYSIISDLVGVSEQYASKYMRGECKN